MMYQLRTRDQQKKGANVLFVDENIFPQNLAVIRTRVIPQGMTILVGDYKTLEFAPEIFGCIIQYPNSNGNVEDYREFVEKAHAAGAKVAVDADILSLAMLVPPGEWGADIVCGDSQSLGIPLCYGGPYVGFLACKKDHVRKLPGRIVGATRDVDGKRAYVLTLQAREQHIRREKATSNICSNQSLMALYVTVYMSLMGPKGLRQVNELSYGGAHYLHDQLLDTGLFEKAFDKPFLKEFTLKSLMPVEELQNALQLIGVFGAVEVEPGLVNFCVTEKVSKENIDAVVEYLTNCSLVISSEQSESRNL
jgi:glycine cleavage system pyridoxal-binding protein P